MGKCMGAAVCFGSGLTPSLSMMNPANESLSIALELDLEIVSSLRFRAAVENNSLSVL